MSRSTGTLAEMYASSSNNIASCLRLPEHTLVVKPVIHECRLMVQVAWLKAEGDETPLGLVIGTDLKDAIQQAGEAMGEWFPQLAEQAIWQHNGRIVDTVHTEHLTGALYVGLDLNDFLLGYELAASQAQYKLNYGWWWKAKWSPSDRPDLSFMLTRRNSPAEWMVTAWYRGHHAEYHHPSFSYAVALCLERIYEQFPLHKRIRRLWRNQPV